MVYIQLILIQNVESNPREIYENLKYSKKYYQENSYGKRCYGPRIRLDPKLLVGSDPVGYEIIFNSEFR